MHDFTSKFKKHLFYYRITFSEFHLEKRGSLVQLASLFIVKKTLNMSELLISMLPLAPQCRQKIKTAFTSQRPCWSWRPELKLAHLSLEKGFGVISNVSASLLMRLYNLMRAYCQEHKRDYF